MHEIVRSRLAKADIIDIWRTIADSNPNAATRMVRRIDERIKRLADFPELGPERPDLAPDLRVLIEGNYLILYRLTETSVEVVRVVHGARDMTALF